jgi:uncharacterized protein YecE (DUF72 family)
VTQGLRIGTSGWNYPTGLGTWNGIFYPPARTKGFDELAFYAEHFDTVEVNSTFYGQPRAAVCRAWTERTPPGFEFSLKLYQKFTHPRMYKERVAGGLAMTAPAGNEWVETIATPNEADVDEFRRGIDPLATAGKLGSLLAQFPPSFKQTTASRNYLAGLLSAFSGYPLAVELRHKSWSDDVARTLALLNEFESAWVQIDEPKFKLSIRQNYLPNVRGFYYMRLHGRNVEQWWHHKRPEDRYNYLYSAGELKEFVETADAVRRLVKKMYLYTNNHFSAQSVANAVMIKQQLGEPIDGEYPPEFLARYPELGGVVTPQSAVLNRRSTIVVTPSRTSG